MDARALDEITRESITQADMDTLRELAAGFATLEENDPDRIAFLERAQSDAVCMNRFHQARRVVDLLDAQPVPSLPNEVALQRVSADILQTMDREGAPIEMPWWTFPVTAALGVSMWIIGLALTQHMLSGVPLAITSLLIAAMSVAAVKWSAYGKWPLIGALAASVAAPLLLPRVVAPVKFELLIGCSFVEFLSALVPVAILAWGTLNGRKVAQSPLSFATAAAIGALAAQLGLHAACPIIAPSHTLPWHTGAVLLATILTFSIAKQQMLRSANNQNNC